GYSSLSYLSRLPIDKLKIDAGFIRRVGSDEHDTAIVSTIVTLAHNLGLKVIAEGVENERQLRFLGDLGCDEAQGFYFGRPMPADEAAALIVHASAKDPRLPALGKRHG